MSAAITPLFGASVLDFGPTINSKSALADFADLIIVVLVGVGLLILLLIWAKYFRKHRRRRRIHHHEARKVYAEIPAPAEDVNAHERRRYKFRYRRREHRGRNPTLAETGGLPAPATSPAERQSPPQK